MNIEAFIDFVIDDVKEVNTDFMDNYDLKSEDLIKGSYKLKNAIKNEIVMLFESYNIGVDCDIDNLYAIVNNTHKCTATNHVGVCDMCMERE